MRAKLAVAIAVALVFAPGWGGERSAAQNDGSTEVAARMLAPTFDEADTNAQSAQKRLERQSPRSDRSKFTLWRSGSDTPHMPLGLILASTFAVAFLRQLRDPRTRPRRAPPLPLTV